MTIIWYLCILYEYFMKTNWREKNLYRFPFIWERCAVEYLPRDILWKVSEKKNVLDCLFIYLYAYVVIN